ncbi:hypothetical protein EV356DRAFT_501917 [Viridothelium virens]|uniref:Uncharacterized protein n=1 Tax=Viridothelium virens TaxID=1048519 RepID=A0A6A6H8B5_VIRVR|nr:hypothetical protein EV356DRAFT_501917 [Viridothelium virens]
METRAHSPSDKATTQKILQVTSHTRSCPHSLDALEGPQGYGWWIRDQIQRQPQELFSFLPDYAPSTHPQWSASFIELWKGVSRFMLAEERMSIDDITVRLCEDGVLQAKHEQGTRFAPQSLVFMVIGWQTMLYQPDVRSCPPVQLAIVNEMGFYQGYSRMCLKQDLSGCRNLLDEFLLGFGVLLPPQDFDMLPDSCKEDAPSQGIKHVSAVSFNAHLLTTIGDLAIEWVDSLSCHLEFDAGSRKVFLFRYPAFCARHLPPSGTSDTRYSVVHACANPSRSTRQWATATQVTQLLNETILSYRLVFGQNKRARRVYRSLSPFENRPREGRDEFLDSLCGHKRLRTSLEVRERENYDLSHDFPILKPRLAALSHYLSERRPRTWIELWHDKRDSASWLTFWAVLGFGVLGILLALLQVIFQIIQVLSF